jgi:hypothetical protein
VSSRGSAKSRASQASLEFKSRCDAMKQAGAPGKVAELFARLEKPLSALSMGASYVARACGNHMLELNEDDKEMLRHYFPDTAPRAVGNSNVPLAEQTPPQRVPAEQTPAPRAPPQTAPPAPRQVPQVPLEQQQQQQERWSGSPSGPSSQSGDSSPRSAAAERQGDEARHGRSQGSSRDSGKSRSSRDSGKSRSSRD